MNAMIEEWLSYLSERQLKILSLTFGLSSKGVTLRQSELARKLGMKKQDIQRELTYIFAPLDYPHLTPLKQYLLSNE